MQGCMIDIQGSRVISEEKNFIEKIKSQFFGGSSSNRNNVKVPVQFRKDYPSIFKGDF